MTGQMWVDAWDPSYGSSLTDGAMDDSSARLTLDLETSPANWAPVTPIVDSWRPAELLVVDGVRRIDARVWYSDDDHPAPVLGIAASVAAGVVRIGVASDNPDRRQARVAEIRMGRGVYTSWSNATDMITPVATYPIRHAAGAEFEDLQAAAQQHMRELELTAALATRDNDDDLMILDGPLSGRTTIPRTLGYIKTHHAAYLPPELNAVVARLGPGQRTPVFTIGTNWSRHSWYLRLPTAAPSPWAGVVRCEAADSLSRDAVIRLADTSAHLLPGLASEPHKDARAPQNLIPIGGLEKALRHRLGDPTKLHRALAATAAAHFPIGTAS